MKTFEQIVAAYQKKLERDRKYSRARRQTHREERNAQKRRWNAKRPRTGRPKGSKTEPLIFEMATAEEIREALGDLVHLGGTALKWGTILIT